MAPGQLVAPVGGEQQEGPLAEVVDDVAEELEAGRVGPMEVF